MELDWYGHIEKYRLQTNQMIVAFESETNIVGEVFEKMTAGEFFEKLLALKKNAEAQAGKDKDIMIDPRARK